MVAEAHKWLQGQDVSFYSQDLENLVVRYKCLDKFGDYAEKHRTDVRTYPWAFLVFTYLHSRKKQ
jgi:hypothetical protein